MIMLDTTSCIDFLKGDARIRKFIESNSSNLFAINSIVIYEINVGLERTRRKMGAKRYNALNQSWREFQSNLKFFAIDGLSAERAAQIYDHLESKGQKIDDNDCLIAGVMKSHNISKILTRNADHFNRIEGLEVFTY